MIFGAGSLEHMVSGDFDSQSPLYYNIHRERLCAAEHSSHSANVQRIDRSISGKENVVVGKKKAETSALRKCYAAVPAA